jgi:hypothetical protein
MILSFIQKPFPRRERFFLLGALFLAFFSLSTPLFAYRILFYYNRFDGTQGGFLHCVAALRDAGHQVDVVDVAGVNHDPGDDNWGSYDQVWDMRFVDENKGTCGSGDPGSPDYFNGRWRKKAADYLAHCGKLFLGAENYQLTDRDEGLYRFLKNIGAVREGYEACPPSRRGNSITEDLSYYPVLNGLGPVSLWGAWVGGIPLSYLTGTSFVQTREGWQGDDRVERSIASGWNGSQLADVEGPACAKGRLFVVWDATMWTLWNLGTLSPDDSREVENEKKTTLRFFPAVAQWLGGWDCSCGSRMPPPTRLSAPVPTPTPKRIVIQPSPTGAVTVGSNSRSLLSGGPSSLTSPPANPALPVTLAFTHPPVNIYVRFADGAGRYQLAVEDGQGRLLEVLLDAPVTEGGEVWASWDGKSPGGNLAGPGLYQAVLWKNGKTLRSILLQWLPVP